MQRDLARPELWEESVQRSRERRFERAQAPAGRGSRARQGASRDARASRAAPPSAVELPDRSDIRELSDFDPWQRSLARSRARRDALASAPTFEIPPGRVSVAAAALLLTGGSVAVASGTIGGDGPDWSAATSGDQGDAIAKAPSTDTHRAAAPARDQPQAPKKAAAAKPAPAPAPKRPTEPVDTAAVDGTITATPEAQRALRPPPRPRKTTTVAARKTKHQPSRRGGGVAALQRALDVPVDGTFGPSTQRALKRWQGAQGMASDGVVGPQTRAALHLAKGPVLKRKRERKPGARHHGRRKVVAATHKRAAATRERHGGGVRGLQRALGLSPDGVFGPGTEKALKRWQRSHGLPGDGVAGPQTRRALQLAPGPVLKRKGRHHGRRHSSTGGGGGGRSSVVQRVIAAADQIATKPYAYGGGHGSFNSSGYDCSGSVSYALHGGGLLASPLDSNAFMSYGKPGPGKHITIYANSGHMFMVVDGRRFDTSGRSQSGSRWGGGQRSTAGYVARHPAGY